MESVFSRSHDGIAVRMNKDAPSICEARYRLEGEACGIPHLAKNERDVGHPAAVMLQKFWCTPALFFRPLVAGIKSKSVLLVDAEGLHGFDS